jgi:micrococcal nuclease
MRASLRKPLLLVIVIVLVLAGYSYTDVRELFALPPGGSAVPAGSYRVVKVADGDTITIDKDGAHQSVRLIGVDTPETVDPRQPVQCFGEEATRAVRALVADKIVRIETDSSQGEYDTYGRLLAYVFAPDGTLVNKYLIAEGFGHEYTFRIPYTYQADFRAAEADARLAQKGLWSPGVCE